MIESPYAGLLSNEEYDTLVEFAKELYNSNQNLFAFFTPESNARWMEVLSEAVESGDTDKILAILDDEPILERIETWDELNNAQKCDVINSVVVSIRVHGQSILEEAATRREEKNHTGG